MSKVCEQKQLFLLKLSSRSICHRKIERLSMQYVLELENTFKNLANIWIFVPALLQITCNIWAMWTVTIMLLHPQHTYPSLCSLGPNIHDRHRSRLWQWSRWGFTHGCSCGSTEAGSTSDNTAQRVLSVHKPGSGGTGGGCWGIGPAVEGLASIGTGSLWMLDEGSLGGASTSDLASATFCSEADCVATN